MRIDPDVAPRWQIEPSARIPEPEPLGRQRDSQPAHAQLDPPEALAHDPDCLMVHRSDTQLSDAACRASEPPIAGRISI